MPVTLTDSEIRRILDTLSKVKIPREGGTKSEMRRIENALARCRLILRKAHRRTISKEVRNSDTEVVVFS